MNFAEIILDWYQQYKRTMPWRKTQEPYRVWLSEIILQQTRVNQGTPYYLKFIENYPTIHDLADAKEEAVLKLWQGLGYYSRARNLHATAQQIVKEYKGVFPESYDALIKLKGIGDYTASAITSICFNKPNATVDGNVYRVLARFLGDFTPINSSAGVKSFKKIAQQLISKKSPGTYNQAIMEFGSLQCKPQNPSCNDCPLHTNCYSFLNNTVISLPVKENKTKVKKKYFNYLVINTPKNKTVFIKRTTGIWKNLYEFPLIESIKNEENSTLLKKEIAKKYLFKADSISIYNKNPIQHKLSHLHIYATFWIIKEEPTSFEFINWERVKEYPTSVLINNFLKTYLKN